MVRRRCRTASCRRGRQRFGDAAGYCCTSCKLEGSQTHATVCTLLTENSAIDARAHPGDLVISSAPRRTGKYLYIQNGSALIAVARFLSDEAAEKFSEWAQSCSEMGLKIDWNDDDGEEGHRPEQA